MGLADRDYFRRPPPSNPFGNPRNWSFTSWLIAINVVVFILDGVTRGLLSEWGYFSVAKAIYGLELWRLLTCQFLHAGTQHIFMNMIALYFAGPMIESSLGSRRYLAFYLICGFAGPPMCMLFSAVGFLQVGPHTAMVGASAGIFGVLIALAVLNPNMRVMFNFVIPISMRNMAFLLLGLAIFSIAFQEQDAGGEAAHLGGAVAGYFLIKNPSLLNWANYRRGPRMRYRP